MPRNKTPVSELGTICACGAEFGAHMQFHNEGVENTRIYGPGRGCQNEAQTDLHPTRAVGPLEVSEQHTKKISKSCWLKLGVLSCQLNIKVDYSKVSTPTLGRRVLSPRALCFPGLGSSHGPSALRHDPPGKRNG